MIKNKKLMMALSFTLGTTLLVSTAFADIMSTSGYEHLKQAIKHTSKSCAKNLDSFTAQFSVTIKDNEKVFYSSTQTSKIDNTSGSSQNKSIDEYYNGEPNKSESYRDKKCNIWYNAWNDTYQIYEYAQDTESTQNDIFEEDEIKDIEKIIDAGVGNLKDYVLVEENSDGSKEFSGSLDNAQIPALVNAISSFAIKRAIPDVGIEIDDVFPKIQNDVFIKTVSGKATINEDGILERIYGSGVISGKCEDGTAHELTLEVLVRIYDINSTIVTKPDLSDKKIETMYENNSLNISTQQKYIGKYKQDIVIDENNSFSKIGERIVVIESIDDKYLSGKYFETYKAEYVDYSKDKLEFDFNAEIEGYDTALFELTNDQKDIGTVNINFDENTGKIYFYIDYLLKNDLGPRYIDHTFIRVFED